MKGQSCNVCEYFSPAHTCIEKPTWGHCMKLVKVKPDWSTGKLRPRFTWADNHCEEFQMRTASALHQEK